MWKQFTYNNWGVFNEKSNFGKLFLKKLLGALCQKSEKSIFTTILLITEVIVILTGCLYSSWHFLYTIQFIYFDKQNDK